MTAIDFDGLRALRDAATPGAWQTPPGSDRYGAIVSRHADALGTRGGDNDEAYGGALIAESIQKSDALLIVAAVALVDALLAQAPSR